ALRRDLAHEPVDAIGIGHVERVPGHAGVEGLAGGAPGHVAAVDLVPAGTQLRDEIEPHLSARARDQYAHRPSPKPASWPSPGMIRGNAVPGQAGAARPLVGALTSPRPPALHRRWHHPWGAPGCPLAYRWPPRAPPQTFAGTPTMPPLGGTRLPACLPL